MTIEQLQPYLIAISAGLSVATLGFMLNLVKAVRDNAQDRIAVQEERLKRAADDQQRIEKWAGREKAELKEQLDKAKSEMDSLLKSQGIDLANLTLGKQLSESAGAVRETAEALIKEMKDKLSQLTDSRDDRSLQDRDWELTLAMGEMAQGSFAAAATHFDAHSKLDGVSWETHFVRGVAHANARGGFESNLASLRAYNEAIALAPPSLGKNRKARLFAYRGAILKRLNRTQEAESDLKIASALADARYERADISYNLACVYAMQGRKEEMLKELQNLGANSEYMYAVKTHLHDYFANFNHDPDFMGAISPGRRAQVL